MPSYRTCLVLSILLNVVMLLGFVALYFDVFAQWLPLRFSDLPEHNQSYSLWVVLGQSLLCILMIWLSRHPQYCSHPVKVTDANRTALYRLCQLMLLRLLLVCSLGSLALLVQFLAPFFSVELLSALFLTGLSGVMLWICVLHLRAALRLQA